MSVQFMRSVGTKPDDTTAQYVGKFGVRNYTFDRPEAHVFELITVTKQASAFDPPQDGQGGMPAEKTYLLDTEYSVSDGVPLALEAAIRGYAERECADDVTSDNIDIIVSLRHHN